MKHIKLKILCVIWLSVIVIFAGFVGIINLIIPSHFEKEAKNALIYEMEYIDRLTDEDDSEDEYEANFLSGNINFINFFDEGYEVSGLPVKNSEANSSAQNSENEIRSHYSLNSLKEGDIKTLITDKGYYVLVKYHDVFTTDGSYQSTVMYINIQTLVNYVRSLNWVFAAIFVAVVAVMSVIGYKLGRRIEDDHEANHKFFQNSSHELKTPLMAIQGYAEGIEAGVVDIPSSAEIIMRESDKMAHMIDALLSISKIDANQLQLNMTTSDLREILYDCMRSVEPIQQQKKITITPMFPESPVWVHCDENQLSRVFVNVLMNGIRHCNSAVVISCTIEQKSAVVKISDDGNGIAEDDMPHIFDRFYTGTKGSTGIGLALSREIVNLHKGTVTAHNEVGAVFEIRLPLTKS